MLVWEKGGPGQRETQPTEAIAARVGALRTWLGRRQEVAAEHGIIHRLGALMWPNDAVAHVRLLGEREHERGIRPGSLHAAAKAPLL